MEPLDKINEILNSLPIPPEKLIELKTQIVLMGMSEFKKGADLSLDIFKNMNKTDTL